MIVDNGKRRQLDIPGVFAGQCGESAGMLAFIPNRSGKKPEQALAGTLDGRAVRVWVTRNPEPGSPFYSARYEALS